MYLRYQLLSFFDLLLKTEEVVEEEGMNNSIPYHADVISELDQSFRVRNNLISSYFLFKELQE